MRCRMVGEVVVVLAVVAVVVAVVVALAVIVVSLGMALCLQIVRFIDLLKRRYGPLHCIIRNAIMYIVVVTTERRGQIFNERAYS